MRRQASSIGPHPLGIGGGDRLGGRDHDRGVPAQAYRETARLPGGGDVVPGRHRARAGQQLCRLPLGSGAFGRRRSCRPRGRGRAGGRIRPGPAGRPVPHSVTASDVKMTKADIIRKQNRGGDDSPTQDQGGDRGLQGPGPSSKRPNRGSTTAGSATAGFLSSTPRPWSRSAPARRATPHCRMSKSAPLHPPKRQKSRRLRLLFCPISGAAAPYASLDDSVP